MVMAHEVANLKFSTPEQRRETFAAYAAIGTPREVNTPALMVRETLRCQARFAYFLRYCKIEDAHKGLIPFEMWDYLIEIADDWQAGDSWIEGKGRQEGYSYLIAAYCTWKAMTQDFARILVFSITQRESNELVEKIKAVSEHLPDWLRLDFKKQTDSELVWEGTGAQLLAMPSTGQAGRSYTATLVITDEWAFHQNAAEHFSAYRPAIADGGQHIAVSTGNGPNNLFARFFLYGDASIPYRKRFNGWRVRPGRTDAWFQKELNAFLAASMNPMDDRNFGKHPGMFRRENPDTIADMFTAFVGLVYDIFDPRRHVRGATFNWQDAAVRVAAVDPGQGDPAGITFVAEAKNGHAHVFEEFYSLEVTPASVIIDKLKEWDERAPLDAIWVDGNEGTLIATINQAFGRTSANPIAFAANKEREVGIGHLYGRLLAGDLTIDPACRSLVREFQSYRWRRGSSPEFGEKWQTSTPVEHHGDLLDTLRYALMGIAKGFQRAIPPSAQPEYWHERRNRNTHTGQAIERAARIVKRGGQFVDAGIRRPSAPVSASRPVRRRPQPRYPQPGRGAGMGSMNPFGR